MTRLVKSYESAVCIEFQPKTFSNKGFSEWYKKQDLIKNGIFTFAHLVNLFEQTPKGDKAISPFFVRPIAHFLCKGVDVLIVRFFVCAGILYNIGRPLSVIYLP